MTANCSSFNTKQCIHHQIKRTCPKGMDSCMRTHVSGIFNGATIDVEKRSCASTSTCGSLKTSCDRDRMNLTDVKCDWSCCRSDLCNVGHDVGYSPILFLVVAFLTVFLWPTIFKTPAVVTKRLWLNSTCLLILGRFWTICITAECIRKTWEHISCIERQYAHLWMVVFLAMTNYIQRTLFKFCWRMHPFCCCFCCCCCCHFCFLNVTQRSPIAWQPKQKPLWRQGQGKTFQ